ncbi:hypothetical protein [Sansalvadorimonas verongulae]|uniref:hypothetical protein n=1 Tax=Sansalvadorimonas verongulae TaxID=2172824 RepID=UPI0012BC98D3|nr:hypothetical protein [Sansalvadorimonas verongulae]
MNKTLREALGRLAVVAKILKKATGELTPDEVESCGDILSDAYSDLLDSLDSTDDA